MNLEQRMKELGFEKGLHFIEQSMLIAGYLGGVDRYWMCVYKLKGLSYRQVANKFAVSKRKVQCVIKKCNLQGYDIVLKELWDMK